MQQRIAVVIGSTRPTRICAGIAAWACGAIGDGSELSYELLDLAEVGLPFLDEPLKAALGDYKHEHTRVWSRTAQSYDGFLFVFPQYNWGYPAVLKGRRRGWDSSSAVTGCCSSGVGRGPRRRWRAPAGWRSARPRLWR
jgi:hypothetical protein